MLYPDLAANEPTRGEVEQRRREAWTELRRSAAVLAEGEPQPSWFTALGVPAVDGVWPVGVQHALVGVTSFDTRGQPTRGPLWCIDLATGRVLWQHARSPSRSAGGWVAGSSHGVAVTETDGENATTSLVALGSGKSLVQLKSVTALLPAADGWLVATQGEGATKISRYSADGQRQWESPAGPGQGSVRLELHQGSLWVLGANVVALDATTGARQWTAEVQAATGGVELAGAVLVGGPSEVARIDPGGRVAWRRPLDGLPRVLHAAQDVVVVGVARQGSQGAALVGLDAQTGAARWSTPVQGHLMSNLAARDGRAYIVVEAALWVVSTRDGTVAARVGLGSESDLQGVDGRRPRRFADQLVLTDTHLVVAGDHRVSAHRFEDGGPLWRLGVAGTTAGLSDTMLAVSLATGLPGDAARALAEGLGERSLNLVQATAAVQSRAEANRPAPTQVDLDRQARATNMAHVVPTLSAPLAAGVSANMAMNAALALQEARATEAFNAGTGYAARVLLEQNASSLRLGDRFYVRGFERKSYGLGAADTGRNGVVIVDVTTGAWAEVTTSPHHQSLGFNHLSMPRPQALPVVFAGQRVVARGIGVRPAVWKSGPGVGQEEDIAPTEGLLAFDLERLEWAPPEAYATRRKPLGGRPGFDARRAAAEGNGLPLDEATRRWGTPARPSDWVAEWYFAEEVAGVPCGTVTSCRVSQGKLAGCEASARACPK